jgi:hypothetical protein
VFSASKMHRPRAGVEHAVGGGRAFEFDSV